MEILSMRSMNQRTLAYLLLSASLLALLSGQTQNPPAQQPQPTAAPAAPGSTRDGAVVFKTTAQLVVETVTVKDKDGKPVEGLTAKDFTVTEDNVPQTVAFCEFQKFNDLEAAELQRRPEPTAAPVDAQTKVAPVTDTQIMPEAPGDIRYRDRRMIVLYFDMTGMPEADQFRAQFAGVKFIKTKMQPADLLAVVKFSDGVKVLQDFTGDRDKLLKALDNLKIGEAQGFDEAFNDDSSSDTGTAFGEDDAEFNLFTTDRQLAALETTVKMLGALNEKKVLVYFASGLNLNGADNQAQYQATVNAATRANVAFWTVDARGLVASSPLGDATRGSQGGIGMYNGAAAMAMQSNMQRSQDTMYGLATDTGGKALLDNNELAMGIVNAEQSITSYYILGYYSKNEALDGKFRRIKVTYTGDASAKLSYRAGYFAGKTFNKFTTADKDRQLQDALMMGDPITDLTIALEVNYFQLNSAEYYVPVTFKIPGSELALARRGGAEHTVIEFIGELKDEYNTTVDNVRDHVDKKLTGQTAAQLARQPIQYQTAFTMLPGAYTIKVLARDDETGRIGTYISKFVVPNLNKELKRIPISSVVLSGQRIAIADALFNVKDKGGPTVSPLIQDGMQVIPSVTRVFSKSRDMYIYLQAYERGATAMQPLVAFVTFYRGQSKAFETPPLPVTEGMDPKSKAVPLRFNLALGKLTPGRYNCQVTVLDPTGNRTAFWQAPVALVP
jgi:VWFA-related protein